MAEFDRKFPKALTDLHALPFDHDDGKGIDFEPYDQFSSVGENLAWFRAWTGNKAVTGSEYRIFGQDGTGGYAVFWLVRPQAPLLDQPIAFFGSEGELGLIARDFADYLWVLASGLGPCEAVDHPELPKRRPSKPFTAFARTHAPERERPAAAIIEAARAEFPRFAADVQALTR